MLNRRFYIFIFVLKLKNADVSFHVSAQIISFNKELSFPILFILIQ